jgi:hypothetical protein
MLVKKIITTTINITDAINYSANEMSTLMSILIRRFTNKCYNGSYIIEVMKILEKSPCRVQKTNLSGDGYVDVMFEVLASIINTGDIITNCIIHKIDTCVTCESNTDGAALIGIPLTNQIAKVVSIGQILSVTVVAVRYDVTKSKISVIGVPVECDKQNIVYKVDGRLSSNEYANITELCKKIYELYENRKLIMSANNTSVTRMEHVITLEGFNGIARRGDKHKKELEWYSGLIGPITFMPDPLGELVNILAVCKDADYNYTGLWGRSPTLVKSSPFVNKYTDDAPHELVVCTPFHMVLTMLNSIYKYAKYINETSVIYSKESEYKRHLHIWMSMK